MNSIEIFGLLPHLQFNIKVKDKNTKREIVYIILEKENIKDKDCNDYLEKNFNNNDNFYPIEIEFWNTLVDESKEIPDMVTNSKIADEIKIESKVKNNDNKKEENKH